MWKPTRPDARRYLGVAMSLTLTLAVTFALAWSAWDARSKHRQAAEATVRDHASFAAAVAAANVEAALDQVLLYAFYAADLADRRGSTEPVPPAALASNPAEAGRCAETYPGGRWFARVEPGGGLEVEGSLAPKARRWLADTLSALMREPGETRYGNLFSPASSAGAPAAYRIRRDSLGAAIEAHALAHCFEGQGGSVFETAPFRSPLPPPVRAGEGAWDSLLTLTVTAPRGAVLHETASPTTRGFREERPPDAHGPLEGLRFAVSVPPGLADRWVEGGVPAGPGAGTALLVVLALALGVATLMQVRGSLALVRTRERFVADVSHELRTPLQQILLFVQLIRLRRVSGSDREESLEIVERETLRLIALVERVLSFARSGSSAPADGEMATVDAAAVVRATVEAFRPMAEAAGAEVAVELAPGAHQVRGGAGPLRQVLLNLLDNATRYGPRGQRVRVRTRMEEGCLRLTVEDEGPGIPADQRERVWEPFHRLEREAASGRGGSGIGLAIVRDLVEAMGGRTWIEEGEAGGTVVVVLLTAAAGPVEDSS